MVMLLLNLIGLLLETGVYAYLWFNVFYPRINHSNTGLKFYINGHILIIAIYFILLYFFTSTYGGLKVGYLKPMDVILSDIVSVVIVNVVTYAQLSLMNNWLLPVRTFLLMLCMQAFISILWTLLCNLIYHKVYPPREILLVHGDRPYEDIVRKFNSRADKFFVSKVVPCENCDSKVVPCECSSLKFLENSKENVMV